MRNRQTYNGITSAKSYTKIVDKVQPGRQKPQGSAAHHQRQGDGTLAWIRLLSGKKAVPLTEAAIEALSPVKDLIHTITADNGKEFCFHERMAERLEVLVFFAKPYHSWERDTNENTNGLIRQYFPKGTDFATITPEQVQWVQDKLNSRPRKRLGYSHPKRNLNN